MKIVLTLCGVVLGGMLSMSVARAEVAPGAPTILVPMSQAHTSSVKPVIAGVTQVGTQVDVYIDQQFNGRATVQASVTETAATGWSYVPFLNLSQGWHTVTVKAQNAAGARSAVGSPVYIYIDLLVPAPTLLTPVVNADTRNTQPWIVGLSKGGMTLEVWIDGRLNGQVEVGGTRAQTQSFKYRPSLPLSVGAHAVRVLASDSFGGQAQPVTTQVTVLAEVVTTSSLASTETTTTDEPAPESTSSLPAQSEQPATQPAATVTTADPSIEPTDESTDSQTSPSDTNAAVTTETNSTNTVNSEVPTSSKRENVLTTIGWVLLALVAIGMITRSRAKQPATDDQLVKIDTSDSKPHVEVIRKPVDSSSATPSVSPVLPPTQPPAPPLV